MGELLAEAAPAEPPSPLSVRRASTAPACLEARTLRTRVGRAAGKHRPEACLEHEAARWRARRRPRDLAEEDRALVQERLQHEACALLHEEDLGVLLGSLEYFAFEAGQTLVRQGDLCRRFFVVGSGSLRVEAEARGAVGSLRRGDSFGGSALLLDAPQPVSVVAAEEAGVWATDGEAFRRVLQADAQRRLAENRRLLDSLPQLGGLSQQQRARVAEAAVFAEVHEAGARVASEGEELAAVRVVRAGRLAVLAGGARVRELRAGDAFGKGALHGRALSRVTVVAETRCELACVGIPVVRAVLGRDHAAALSRGLAALCLERTPPGALSRLPAARRRLLAEEMELADCPPGERLNAGGGGGLLLLLDGGARAAPGAAGAAGAPPPEPGQLLPEGPGAAALVAGPRGARLARLAPGRLEAALREADAAEAERARAAAEARARLLAGLLPLLHEVPCGRAAGLAERLEPVRLPRGSCVFEQGAEGAEVWLVEEGELQELVGGRPARVVGRNGHCGLRAALLGEPRRSTVRVLSEEARLWRLPGEVFVAEVPEGARQELAWRLEYRLTDVALADLRPGRVLGRGGFGSVRRVEHRTAPLEYALKRVRKRHGHVELMVARECALLSELDHPFVLLLVKTFDTASSVYILTELLTGGDLLTALDVIARPLTRPEAQFYAGSLLLVLEFLHDRRIVFRDLKPENVMLDAGGYVKLIDFGTAKKLEGPGEGRAFTRVGSPHFMAPEVVKGRGYGTAVDWWSLGVMLFEFVCGYLPFARDVADPTGVEVCRAVQLENLAFPPRYADRPGKYLLRGLLSKEPEARLGAGAGGRDCLREHEYFAAPGGLFEHLLRRQVAPPHLPGAGAPAEEGGAASELSELGG